MGNAGLGGLFLIEEADEMPRRGSGAGVVLV